MLCVFVFFKLWLRLEEKKISTDIEKDFSSLFLLLFFSCTVAVWPGSYF